MLLFKNTFTILFLTKNTSQKLHIRTMMAEGSIFKLKQKQIAALVLSIHFKFLSQKTVTERDLLINFKYGMLIAGKPFQHFMNVLYGKKQFSTELVKSTFPEIGIEDKNPFLDLNHVLAIASGSFLKEQPFFQQNNLYAYAGAAYSQNMPFQLKLDKASTAFPQNIYRF